MTTRAAILLGVLAVLAASYAFPLRAWLDQRATLAAAEAERDSLAAEVSALTQARDLWEDPAYVRAQARERLNFVLPGEVGLVVLGTQSTSTEPDVPAGPVVPAVEEGQPWWSTLVAAFDEAGAVAPDSGGTSPAP
jgi:cell division protein FtsB